MKLKYCDFLFLMTAWVLLGQKLKTRAIRCYLPLIGDSEVIFLQYFYKYVRKK